MLHTNPVFLADQWSILVVSDSNELFHDNHGSLHGFLKSFESPIFSVKYTCGINLDWIYEIVIYK